LFELAVRSGLKVLETMLEEDRTARCGPRHARSLEPVPATMRSRGTSKSAVSRRFVAKTAAQLAAWQTASLEALELVGVKPLAQPFDVPVEIMLIENLIQSRVERMSGAPRQVLGRHPHRSLRRTPSSFAHRHRRPFST